MYNNQEKFNIRCEWGLKGVEKLSKISKVTVIIDILSFSTSVDIATSRGAIIYPYQYNDLSQLEDYSKKINAIIAEKRNKINYSLSPSSLIGIKPKTKLILPSPNGSTLTLASESEYTITCCLRNYKAVADFINNIGGEISVIPCGERWEDDSLRPSIEDLLGAGALISLLKGTLSSESQIAKSVFQSNENNLRTLIYDSISGLELIEKKYSQDLELALDLNISNYVPILKNKSFYS